MKDFYTTKTGIKCGILAPSAPIEMAHDQEWVSALLVPAPKSLGFFAKIIRIFKKGMR